MDRESDRGSSEAGSGRGTPRSMDHEPMRCDTPGTMPTYQYSLDQLYDLESAPASCLPPDCLEKEFFADGTWDAERWHRGGSGSGSKSGSRGPSPLNVSDPRERRGEMLRRNSGSSVNPKDRLKEDKDCIVLSPQRRSFGTGCHVSQQPLLQRAISNIQTDTDRDRREQRRIGSGRIQIDRERDQEYRSEREYRNDRGPERAPERDNRDFRSDRHIEKDPRDFRNTRDLERERDRDFRNPRDRFDRDRRFERDRIFSRRDIDDRRDFRDHGSRYNNQRDRRHHREEEPEWFSSGPTSKSDTIELHGFQRDRHDSDRHKEERVIERQKVRREEVEVSDEEVKPQQEGISVADRNGSLETNESSSPETNPSDTNLRPTKTVPTHLPSFDFNEFFSIETIPGLPVPDESIADADPANIGGSRFYQLYRTTLAGAQQISGGSKENSRRSSLMEDEFGYLNDLLNGSRSPVIPSPPPSSANSVFERASFLTPFASSDKEHQLEFGTVGQKFVAPSNTLVNSIVNNATVLDRSRSSPTGRKNSPQDTEAKLKALLFGRLDSASSSGNTTPGFNSPLNAGKVKTLAELEGEIQKANKMVRSMTPPNQLNRASPVAGSNDLTAFNKLISLMQAGAARPVESPKQATKVDPRPPSPLSGMPPGHMQSMHLQQHIMSTQQPGMPAHIQAGPHHPGLPSQVQARPQQPCLNNQIQACVEQHGINTQLQAGSHQPGLNNQIQQPSLNSQIQTGPQQQGMPSHIQAGQQQQGLSSQIQAGPPLGRIIHKPEPLNLQAQHMQNQRASVGEMPFDMMDFSGNMSTPTSVAPPSLDGFHGSMSTPTSVAPPLHDGFNGQKQFLDALQRNKEQQLQIRQAAIHNMRMNQQVSTPGQQSLAATQQLLANNQVSTSGQQSLLATQLVANQTAQQPQHNNVQGRRSSSGDPIMSFLKANPTIITKPASPTPPPQQQPHIPLMNFVQPVKSPRGPSPSPLQSTLLSRQAPGSPRVPSPIMFSQQPPMHLSAPSPIHPSQGGGSLSQSPVPQPNTSTVNSIRPPSVPRVPSPQELIVHTQAILQNALIKKQLEDQKERFYKKQQERVKSPCMVGIRFGLDGNPCPTRMSPVPITSTPVAPKCAVNAAFTPTSVIRKMHSEKAHEKERHRRDSLDIESTERDNQVESLDYDHRLQEHQVSPLRLDHPLLHATPTQPTPPTSIPPPAMIHAVPPPPLPNQVLPNMVAVVPGLPPFNTNHLTHLPPPPSLVSTHLPPPLLSPGALPPPPLPHPQSTALVTQEQIDAVKSQQIRALIGQNANPHGATHAPVSAALPISGRPIVKGNVVSVAPPLATPISMTKDLGQRPIMGGASPVVSAVDMAKLLQRQHISSSPHVIPRGQTTTPYTIPIPGRMPLQTSPVIGAQPPAPGTNPVYIQQMVPGTSPRGYSPYQQLTGLQGQQRMIDPRAARGPLSQSSLQNQGFNPRTLNPQMNQHKNGPISPGIPVSMVTVTNSGNKPENINLMKWFGTDMLKTQLPTMPPLPVQGHTQRVLTLDELERT